jgi:hypothetical protein
MAGIAGERASSAEISFVHTVYHVDHLPDHSFARNIFGELVHVREAFCDMAAGRVQSQGRGKETHGVHELVDGSPFENLPMTSAVFGGPRRRRKGKPTRDCSQPSQCRLMQSEFRSVSHRDLELARQPEAIWRCTVTDPSPRYRSAS